MREELPKAVPFEGRLAMLTETQARALLGDKKYEELEAERRQSEEERKRKQADRRGYKDRPDDYKMADWHLTDEQRGDR